MIKEIVAVRDTAADAFMSPWFVSTRAMAIRSFRQEVNRPAEGNILNTHPQDFELWLLGKFDESKGVFSDNSPSMIIRGVDCVESK